MIVYAAVPDDTRPVRAAEALDWSGLASYLRTGLAAHAGKIAGLDLEAPMEVTQFPGGHSNLTYLVRFAGAELVLRRPPLGPVAPRAHDMAREFKWLAAIHPVYPLAPEPYLLCEDPAVVGSTFYVMERRHGLVVRHEEPPDIANVATRRRISEALVDALAALHAIEVRSGPLAALGRPAGFVARQVQGWTERWQRSRTSQVPDMDAVAAWLAARLPAEPPDPAVVHGDFKLDNVMLDPADAGRLVAVLDWEMSALGDPLVDLGIFLTYWGASGGGDALATVTDRHGWLSREEILEQYARRSGRDVSAIRFYETFARFKIAVVIQQIYFRFVRGQTDDPRFGHFGDRVATLAREAVKLAEASRM